MTVASVLDDDDRDPVFGFRACLGADASAYECGCGWKQRDRSWTELTGIPPTFTYVCDG
jgi:hypothetical protein